MFISELKCSINWRATYFRYVYAHVIDIAAWVSFPHQLFKKAVKKTSDVYSLAIYPLIICNSRFPFHFSGMKVTFEFCSANSNTHSHVSFKVGWYSYCCCPPYSRLRCGRLFLHIAVICILFLRIGPHTVYTQLHMVLFPHQPWLRRWSERPVISIQ